MDIIIKSVITNKFSDIIVIINSKILEDDEYYCLYNYFVYFYIKGLISDLTIYRLTYLLLKQKVLQIGFIRNLDYIMAWHILRQKTGNKTYIILNSHLDKVILKKKIDSKINLLKNGSKYLRIKLADAKKTCQLKKIVKETFLEYTGHFNDKTLQNNIMMHTLQGYQDKSNKGLQGISIVPGIQLLQGFREGLWNHEQEIEDRLLLLVNRFGVHLLSDFGINILDNKYFAQLSFEEKVSYYKDCLDKIILFGTELVDLLKAQKRLKKHKHHNLPQGQTKVLPQGQTKVLPQGQTKVLPQGSTKVLPPGSTKVLHKHKHKIEMK
ncbi:MAG: hypothetical protein Barrevirus31_3 [Barrevirus sp.]|uniref:Uncharacterized protein n=1 Tax=Barrevirus sp. TaxID=2487763 RepID=A0A3G4ZQW5_9VIRU|nr:MAG: hypothetical protein Barrevirus31_3 [Barrevirus sp.]